MLKSLKTAAFTVKNSLACIFFIILCKICDDYMGFGYNNELIIVAKIYWSSKVYELVYNDVSTPLGVNIFSLCVNYSGCCPRC